MVTPIKSYSEYQDRLKYAGDKLVVLYFCTTWCGPCKDIDPHVRRLENIYKDQAVVIKINVDKFQDIADFYNVTRMPTFIFIKSNKRVSSFTGAYASLLTNRMATYIT